MSLNEGVPYVGDIGHTCVVQVFETSLDGTYTIPLDFTVNSLETQEITIKDPDGKVKFKGDSYFLLDGSDGRVAVKLGDIFDQSGIWTKQATLIFGSIAGRDTFNTQEIPFRVIGPRNG